jgi:hypothetical protein
MLLPPELLTELVAVEEAVVDDRRAEAVLQVVQVTLERGRRHLQLVSAAPESSHARGCG